MITLSFEHVALALGKRGAPPCVQWMRVPPGGRAFLAARLFSRLSRTVLYLCPDAKEAEEAARELSAYLGPDLVLPYPSVEVDPYEQASPYLPAVHDRMRALHRILAGLPSSWWPPPTPRSRRPFRPRSSSTRWRRSGRATGSTSGRSPRSSSPSGTPASPRRPIPGTSQCAAGSSTCTAPRTSFRRASSWTTTSSSPCAGSIRRRSGRSRRAPGKGTGRNG